MERVPITIKGKLKVEEELKSLKTIERPRIINAISEARAHGDLSENAEYHAAKEEQGHNETKIMELEDLLSKAEAIDPSNLEGDDVKFGAKPNPSLTSPQKRTHRVYTVNTNEFSMFFWI